MASTISSTLANSISTSPTTTSTSNTVSTNLASQVSTNQMTPATTTASTTTSSSNTDFRVKLSMQSGYTNPYPGILAPLANTNGLLFPYTPTINETHDVEYSSMTMTHSNSDYYAYARTQNVRYNVTAKFTVQNKTEGLYALAARHFIYSATKMYFGEKDAQNGKSGLPPPILLLNGYGTYIYNNVKCILTGPSMSFDENMNMVKITLVNGFVYLPALFTISFSLINQNTARAQRLDFNLDDFRSGALMQNAQSTEGWV